MGSIQHLMNIPGPSYPQFVLTTDWAVTAAKDALHPTPCEWKRCYAELNSWSTLQEHLHQHCNKQPQSSSPFSQPSSYECNCTKCAGRLHGSREDLKKHIDLSHMTRTPVPCPIEGCSATFSSAKAAVAIPEHMQDEHSNLLNRRFPYNYPALRPLRHPQWPPAIQPVAALPVDPVPVYKLLYPTVQERSRLQSTTASQNARRRRWNRMAGSHIPSKSEDESESMPFADLQPVGYWSPDGRFYECKDWKVLRKPPEIYMLQARPQPMTVPPVPEKPPPRSIGYKAFAEKFARLEAAGIIDGSGQWPTEDGEPVKGPLDTQTFRLR